MQIKALNRLSSAAHSPNTTHFRKKNHPKKKVLVVHSLMYTQWLYAEKDVEVFELLPGGMLFAQNAPALGGDACDRGRERTRSSTAGPPSRAGVVPRSGKSRGMTKLPPAEPGRQEVRPSLCWPTAPEQPPAQPGTRVTPVSGSHRREKQKPNGRVAVFHQVLPCVAQFCNGHTQLQIFQ